MIMNWLVPTLIGCLFHMLHGMLTLVSSPCKEVGEVLCSGSAALPTSRQGNTCYPYNAGSSSRNCHVCARSKSWLCSKKKTKTPRKPLMKVVMPYNKAIVSIKPHTSHQYSIIKDVQSSQSNHSPLTLRKSSIFNHVKQRTLRDCCPARR